MDTTAPKSWSERINLRLIVFIAIVAALPLGILYAFVTYNGGHHHTAEGEVVDLKALGNFDFDQNTGTIKDVPSQWQELDGKKVVLEGFMWSDTATSELTEFQLVYNIQKCCYGGPPQVQERVFVHVPKGKKIEWIKDCARVIGTLHVAVKRDSDEHYRRGGRNKDAGLITSVFTLDIDKAEPKD